MPSLGNKVAGVDKKSKLKDARNVSQDREASLSDLLQEVAEFLIEQWAMGMNGGTGLGAVRLKNLKSKVAAVAAAEDGNQCQPNPRVGISSRWEFSDAPTPVTIRTTGHTTRDLPLPLRLHTN
jgi:hypothetical protein